eukprot:SAG11_NODE_3578_length_2358_cov_3.440018_1_plen_189_part_00
MTVLSARLRRHRRVALLPDHAAVRAAALGESPYTGQLIARTRYEPLPGVLEAVLSYPVKTMNVRASPDAWQLDAGPLLLPLPGDVPRGALAGPLPVAALGVGYLVYNRAATVEPVRVRVVQRTAAVDACEPVPGALLLLLAQTPLPRAGCRDVWRQYTSTAVTRVCADRSVAGQSASRECADLRQALH